jgi:DNA primase|tara:strand:+ start:20492 stop:21418 length:927 start_codon:yes stop_codon:yes gene_type:complete
MINELLVNLVNTVLGAGKRTARGNQSYQCPFCNHHKPKLEVNFTENKKGYNPWHCWVCSKKGKTINTLFKQAKASPDKFSELYKLVKTGSEVEEVIVENIVELPKEYKSILGNTDLKAKQAYNYLRKRNLTDDDIIKYNIGYCGFGRYTNMVIIPSYDQNGTLNYFTGRSFEQDPFIKYRNPECSRDIIPFELFINWDSPLVLCEGPFDAIAIKRNAIPLLGKNIQSTLLKRIVQSTVKKIYIALDTDAIKQALKHCEYLLNQGKEVYLVELDGKDPSDLGFSYFTKLIQNTEPIDQYDLMEKKISLI